MGSTRDTAPLPILWLPGSFLGRFCGSNAIISPAVLEKLRWDLSPYSWRTVTPEWSGQIAMGKVSLGGPRPFVTGRNYTYSWYKWNELFFFPVALVTKLNSSLLAKQQSQFTDTRLWWRKVQYLLQGSKQGKQAAHRQKTWSPQWLLEMGF